MPEPRSTGTPSEALYGAHTNGNVPWRSKQLHDISKEFVEAAGKPYARPPSRIAPRNRLQNASAEIVERLLNLGNVPQRYVHQGPLQSYTTLNPQDIAQRIRSVYGDIPADQITPSMLNNIGISDTTGLGLRLLKRKYTEGLSQLPAAPPADATRQAQEDSFDIANREIRDTFDKSHRNQFLGNLENVSRDPFSEGTTDQEIIDKVSGRYNKVGDALIKKMGKNYLENIAPQVDYNYIKNGVFNSPLRLEHRKRVYQNLEERLAPELARLGALGEKEGLEELNQHKLRKLQSTDLGHKIISDEKDRANLAARNLRENEQGKLAAELSKANAANIIGSAEQEQHESHLTDEYLQALAQKEHPFRMLEREAAIVHGTPATAEIPAYKMMNLRPNHAAMGAASLSNLAGAVLPQNKKAGGMVKKYAPGGFVLPEVKQTSQDLQMQQQIEAMHHHNPHEAMLHGIAKAGAETARRYGYPVFGDTIANTHFKHQQKNQVQKERAIGLMQKIQESRLRQQDIMAHYDHQQKALDEQSRHHRTMEGHAAQRMNTKNVPEEIFTGDRVINPRNKVGLTPQDQIELRNVEKQITELEKKEQPYAALKEFLEKNTPNTGWIAEHTPNITDQSREYARDLTEAVSSVIGGQRQTASTLDFAKSRKPTERDSPEAVKKWAQKGLDTAEKEKEVLLLQRDYAGHGIPPRIVKTAYNAWKKNAEEGNFEDYLQAILEGHSVEKTNKMEPSHPIKESGEVRMIGPDGSMAMVPAQNVKSAMQAGAKLA